MFVKLKARPQSFWVSISPYQTHSTCKCEREELAQSPASSSPTRPSGRWRWAGGEGGSLWRFDHCCAWNQAEVLRAGGLQALKIKSSCKCSLIFCLLKSELGVWECFWTIVQFLNKKTNKGKLRKNLHLHMISSKLARLVEAKECLAIAVDTVVELSQVLRPHLLGSGLGNPTRWNWAMCSDLSHQF